MVIVVLIFVRSWLFILIIILIYHPQDSFAQGDEAARVVSFRGDVKVQMRPPSEWQKAVVGMSLGPGAIIRTAEYGRVSLLLADETLVQLNRNSKFVLKEVRSSAAWNLAKNVVPVALSIPKTRLFLEKGAVWLLNKNRNERLEIATPYVSAAIRGTEMVLNAADDGVVTVTLLEGKVQVWNDKGQIGLGAGESAVSRSGSAPVKHLLMQPENAVQWTLLIPPLFTDRELQLLSPKSYFTEIGLFLNHGRLAEAGDLLQSLPQRYQGEPFFKMLQGWLLLEDGDVEKAADILQEVTLADPQQAGGFLLLSLTKFVIGKNAAAMTAAESAARLLPDAVMPLLMKSYIYQALFDLDAAEDEVRHVLALDANHLTALISLSRLLFGKGLSHEALVMIDRASFLAPSNSEILSLKGFIEMAQGDNNEAESLFRQAVENDPAFAEPHLGLGLLMMRWGDVPDAMEEITTAVLLEPRRSLFRSYWAKMLQQINRHQKALDVLDTAHNIDPLDPTPMLYKALILKDMNRPGAAIKQLGRAIEANDNRAVYRSRFLLDKDMAVKNINLASLFDGFVFHDWAKSHAVTSLKYDYLNSAAHLFYAGSQAEEDDRAWGRNTASLHARIMQPANLNSFNTFNDYTSFFEKPALQLNISGMVGSQERRDGKALVFGAVPEYNMAFQAAVFNGRSAGWRTNHFDNQKNIVGYLKWDITDSDGLMLAASNSQLDQGNTLSQRFSAASPSEPRDWFDSGSQRIEAGYQHRFGPGSSILFHFSDLHVDSRALKFALTSTRAGTEVLVNGVLVPALLDLTGEALFETGLAEPYQQIQGEWLKKMARHQLIIGAVSYSGREEMLTNISAPGMTIKQITIVSSGQVLSGQNFGTAPISPTPLYDYSFDRNSLTLYGHDIWQINNSLSIETYLHYDKLDTGDARFASKWTVEQVSPGLGVIVRVASRDTLRTAFFKTVLPYLSDRLEPADIAGIALLRNGEPGSVNEEKNISWEHELKEGFFSVAFFQVDGQLARKKEAPIMVEYNTEVSGIRGSFDKVLNGSLGLSLRGSSRHVENQEFPELSRRDHLLSASFNWIAESGFSASLSQTFRGVDFFKPGYLDQEIWLSDCRLGYELPGKRGKIFAEVNNLFDNEFNWLVDDYVFNGRVPARQYFAGVELNF